jgi:hypothetical protein
MFQKEQNEENETINLLFPFLIVLFVLGAWTLTWYLLKDHTDRGTFGDMFGAVNALFSGLAFVGVIYAILLQGKELKLQRKELRYTRQELKGQKLQLEKQSATLKKQNFENTFFELLRLHNDITNSIDLVDAENKITKGRDCFKVFYTRFKTLWGRTKRQYGESDELDRINKTYLAFYDEHQSELGHYFRSMYNIVKFVDNSDVDNKSLYTNIIRAQLSSFELALLFYNSLSDMGREKFMPLIEEYSLLKTVPTGQLINPPDHSPFYEKRAYGK